MEMLLISLFVLCILFMDCIAAHYYSKANKLEKQLEDAKDEALFYKGLFYKLKSHCKFNNKTNQQ